MITAGSHYCCHFKDGWMVGEGEPSGPAATLGGLSEAGGTESGDPVRCAPCSTQSSGFSCIVLHPARPCNMTPLSTREVVWERGGGAHERHRRELYAKIMPRRLSFSSIWIHVRVNGSGTSSFGLICSPSDSSIQARLGLINDVTLSPHLRSRIISRSA